MTRNCYCRPLDVHLWREGTSESIQLSAQDLCARATDDSTTSSPEVSVIFAKARLIRGCEHCHAAFSQAFAIPPLWWTKFAERSNGYFGYEDVLDQERNRVGAVTWARFIMKHTSYDAPDDNYTSGEKNEPIKYYWTKLNVLSRWHDSQKRTDIILFDHENLAQSISEKLLTNIVKEELSDPFWIYPRMLEEVVSQQDLAVWGTRDLVRHIEKQRAFVRSKDLLALHEIPRHLIHVSETLNVAEITLDSIQKHHNHFLTTITTPPPPPHISSGISIKHRLSFHSHMLASLRHRSDSNKARIQNEMALAYNELTRMDSSAMRTIAFVSLVFLPPTFVSAIFSTSFFNFDAGSGIWTISDKFWYYWAVSIPLTFATILMWYGAPFVWHRIPQTWKAWIP